MEAVIRRASQNDLFILKEFLTKANLGTNGLTEEMVEYFLLLEDDEGELVGTLGIEPIDERGLLRSLAVASGQAEKDIWLLIEQALQLAKDRGIKELFLATNKTGALPLFELLGFQKVPEKALPQELFQSEHVRHILNVDNSLFLKYAIANKKG
ncbi:MAG TPA: GNAT family N-acetyltransferase [Bacillales bacterium]|nr:GNAT family N-acetyltransferase [Bacillales bacterium]